MKTSIIGLLLQIGFVLLITIFNPNKQGQLAY